MGERHRDSTFRQTQKLPATPEIVWEPGKHLPAAPDNSLNTTTTSQSPGFVPRNNCQQNLIFVRQTGAQRKTRASNTVTNSLPLPRKINRSLPWEHLDYRRCCVHLSGQVPRPGWTARTVVHRSRCKGSWPASQESGDWGMMGVPTVLLGTTGCCGLQTSVCTQWQQTTVSTEHQSLLYSFTMLTAVVLHGTQDL